MMRRVFGVMRPPPKLTISQWAETEARLPPGSPKPGLIKLAFTEYQRGILDAVSDPRTHTIVWQASSQVGKTTVELCILGYYAAQNPAPMLFVQPTGTLAHDFGKERVTPFFAASPQLRDLIAKTRSRDSANTLGHKEFSNGGNVTLVGAESPSGLASRPKKIVLLDEVDRFPASAGSEGDPVGLAVKRTTTYFDRKIVMVSSPGMTGASRIEAAYMEGDQRRFHVPCPDCGTRQTLEWEQVKFEHEGDKLVDGSTYYLCNDPECGSCWTDAQIDAAVRKGVWIASQPFNGIASFHLSELYSPFVTMAKTVTDFLVARGNPERLKVWKNTSLGLSFQESGEVPDDQILYERREKEFQLGEVPPFVGILTAGADIQKDRLEIDVWGWGNQLSRALIDHIVIPGDTATDAPWLELANVLSQTWHGTDGREHLLARLALDCGYNTTMAYVFARANSNKVIAVKGQSSYDTSRPVKGPNRVDVKLGNRVLKNGVELYTVSGPAYKSELYSRLRLQRDGDITPAGWVFLPADTSLGWIQQLVSEQMIIVRQKNGTTKIQWMQLRDRNEALDCAVYARAAAQLLGLDNRTPAWWNTRTGIAVEIDAAPDDDPPSSPASPALAAREVADAPRKARRAVRAQSSWMDRLRR